MAELQLRSLSAIKIDVEGAEIEVISGFLNAIRERKPFLVFEVLNNFLVATGQTLSEETKLFRAKRLLRLEGILREEGYEIYNVRPEGLVKVKEIRTRVSADQSATNYVAVPQRDVDAFIKACHSKVTLIPDPAGHLDAVMWPSLPWDRPTFGQPGSESRDTRRFDVPRWTINPTRESHQDSVVVKRPQMK